MNIAVHTLELVCEDGIFCRPKDPNTENGQKALEMKTVSVKRALEDSDGTNDSLSKNKQKKKARNPHKNFSPELKRKAKPFRNIF